MDGDRTSMRRSVYRTQSPYSSRGTQDTPNSADGIFGQDGAFSTLKLKRRRRKGKKARGFVGTINLGVQV